MLVPVEMTVVPAHIMRYMRTHPPSTEGCKIPPFPPSSSQLIECYQQAWSHLCKGQTITIMLTFVFLKQHDFWEYHLLLAITIQQFSKIIPKYIMDWIPCITYICHAKHISFYLNMKSLSKCEKWLQKAQHASSRTLNHEKCLTIIKTCKNNSKNPQQILSPAKKNFLSAETTP